ncbi:MAG TPA: Uma2 family endonuclease [Thermoanaerobaculia bacterium]|nr:Uma2 family endonuclease [Thermoanaerobaculia bacterium]
MAQTAPKLTYDDLVLFPDDGKRHEIINGEHYVSPSPNVRHQRVLRRLSLLLHHFVEANRLGEVFFAPLDVVFSIHDVVQPDFIFVSNARASILTAANLQGSPDLVVEVLSPSNRRYDEDRKRGLYERAEVGEYWIVDPEADTVKVYRREGEQLGRPVLFSARDGDRLTSPLFPGLEIALPDVLAE